MCAALHLRFGVQILLCEKPQKVGNMPRKERHAGSSKCRSSGGNRFAAQRFPPLIPADAVNPEKPHRRREGISPASVTALRLVRKFSHNSLIWNS